MNNTYTALIVEDEEGDAELLQGLLSKYSDIESRGIADSLELAREKILKLRPDLVFLDIELYGKNVFELLDDFRQLSLNFYIVFTTAHSEYAVKAFRYAALDYLLKPIETDKLDAAISRMINAVNGKYNMNRKLDALQIAFDKIIIEETGRDLYLDADDILFLEAVTGENYTQVFLSDRQKPIVISRGLGEMESRLEGNKNFFKIHRSFIVNLDYIKEVNSAKGSVVIDSHTITVSERKARELRKIFRDHKGR